MRILLVEDDTHDVERVLRTFASDPVGRRITIEVVRDGHEALDYLFGRHGNQTTVAENGRRPHLILLDLRLPRVDGMEVLRRLKADVNTRLIPVVVFTAYRDEAMIVESYALGVNSYIVKPSDSDGFSNALSRVGRYWVRLNEPPSY